MTSRTRTTSTKNKESLVREQLLPFRDLMGLSGRIEYDKSNPICIVTQPYLDWALDQNPSFIFRIFNNKEDVTGLPGNVDVPVFDWISHDTYKSAASYIRKKMQATCMIANHTLVYIGAEYARSASTRIRIDG